MRASEVADFVAFLDDGLRSCSRIRWYSNLVHGDPLSAPKPIISFTVSSTKGSLRHRRSHETQLSEARDISWQVPRRGLWQGLPNRAGMPARTAEGREPTNVLGEPGRDTKAGGAALRMTSRTLGRGLVGFGGAFGSPCRGLPRRPSGLCCLLVRAPMCAWLPVSMLAGASRDARCSCCSGAVRGHAGERPAAIADA